MKIEHDITLEELLEQIARETPAQEFKPYVMYNPLDTSISIYLEDVPYVVSWVNRYLSVFLDAGNRDRVVGVRVE